MSRYYWLVVGWLWLLLGSSSGLKADHLGPGTCEVGVTPDCSNTVGEQITFEFTLETGNTSYFVLTQPDNNIVSLEFLLSEMQDSRSYSVPVGTGTWRLAPKAWCKAFELSEESDAFNLQSSLEPIVAQYATLLSQHSQVRSMIKTMEENLVGAIELGEEADIESVRQQIETLEDNDTGVLQQIKSLDDQISALYAKQPDAKAPIVHLDLRAFRVNGVAQTEPLPPLPDPPNEPDPKDIVPEVPDPNPFDLPNPEPDPEPNPYPGPGQIRLSDGEGNQTFFLDIQEAVGVAAAGDVIEVGAGVYDEFVEISGKTSLRLSTVDSAAVRGVRIGSSEDIVLEGFVVDATGTKENGITLLGGKDQSSNVTITNVEVTGAGQNNDGIEVGSGNPNTQIVGSRIHGNARNGISFPEAHGGPHFLELNVITGNGWNGVHLAGGQIVTLLGNTISENGGAPGEGGGRYGVHRAEGQLNFGGPADVTLIDNVIRDNNGNEEPGRSSRDLGNYPEMLDESDTGNQTTSGDEGPGFSPVGHGGARGKKGFMAFMGALRPQDDPPDLRRYIAIVDELEEDPGLATWVNNDDDDNDGVTDSDDPVVPGEDDLSQMWWFLGKPVDDDYAGENFIVDLFSGVLRFWGDREKSESRSNSIGIGELDEHDRVYVEADKVSETDLAEAVECRFLGSCQDGVKKTGIGIEWVKFEPGLAGAGNLQEAPDDRSYAVPGAAQPLGSGIDREYRLFPGKLTPTDAVNRREIDIVVKIKPMRKVPVEISLWAYDPDDPSANTLATPDVPLDTESTIRDNRHTTELGKILFSGKVKPENREPGKAGMHMRGTLNKTNPATGIARARFEVTDVMQPGNNFRIGAALNYIDLFNLKPKHPDDAAAIYFDLIPDKGKKVPENTAPPAAVKQSPLLTIWRRIHMEIDYMGRSDDLFAEGTVDQVQNNGQTIIVRDTTRGSWPGGPAWLDDGHGASGNGRFENGFMIVDAARRYNVSDNNNQTTVNLKNPAPGHDAPARAADVGTPFSLFDDDDRGLFNVDDAVPLDLGLMQESDDPLENVFAYAYIVPVVDGAGNSANNQQSAGNLQPFVLNVDGEEQLTVEELIDEGRHGATDAVNAADYWVGYITSAWQHRRNRDNDPDDESPTTMGQTPTAQAPSGSVVYLESTHDESRHRKLGPDLTGRKVRQVVVHELAHQLSANDAEEFLMSYAPFIAEERFSEMTLWRMRTIPMPESPAKMFH